jgi:hypothetical protein
MPLASAPDESESFTNSQASDDGSTKRTRIATRESTKRKHKNKPSGKVPKSIKILQVILTLFYGQFFANAIYDNFIRGIPDVATEATPFSTIKVIIGVLIAALTVFGMISVWFRIRILLFVNIILLSIVFVFSVVVSIIDLVRRNERKTTIGKDMTSLIIETVVGNLFRVLAIALLCLMIKILHSEAEKKKLYNSSESLGSS